MRRSRKIFTAGNCSALRYVHAYYPSVYDFADILGDSGLLGRVTTMRITSNAYKTVKRNCFLYEVNGFAFVQSWLTIVGVQALNENLFCGKLPFIRLWDGSSRSTQSHVFYAIAELRKCLEYSGIDIYVEHPVFNDELPVANFKAVMKLMAQTQQTQGSLNINDWRYL